MVDLSLATSYIPAIVCQIKTLVFCTMTFFLLPHGGLVFQTIVVMLDRTFLNSDVIIDINALLSSLFFFLILNHEREHNGMVLSNVTLYALSSLWTSCVIYHMAYQKFKIKTELLLHSVFIILISVTHFEREIYTITLVRALLYNTCILVMIYSDISQSVEESLLLKLMRLGPVITTPIIFSGVLFLVATAIVLIQWNPFQFTSQIPDPDLEAAALREALAMRKDKGGN
jgi:hypothetical protein